MDFCSHIDKFASRLKEVESELSDPKVFDSPQKAQDLGREYSRLKELVNLGAAWKRNGEEIESNKEILKQEAPDSELAQMAREEVERLQAESKKLNLELLQGILPEDPADNRNTIVEIRAGAGGTESSLFAADLYRMYIKYSESRGWKIEDMDSSPSDLGGYKEIIFKITGTDVYKRMKFESGVHRVQRVPATEASGRIHTSTATVAVLPEAQEVDIEIKPEELEITVCRAGGPGGQGVNTTDSAVRITHLPTGVVVSCQNEKSQLQNKESALRVLKARLRQAAREAAEATASAARRSQVRTVDRSERIRTYNFPENRIADHRTGFKAYNLDVVLDGELDAVI
ncbi:MAG TPA: peptide chain release factor 1, partial [Verrucomicrobiota bacterium]|nr:peptide chain release factor 1 [Verrucomicrobiota bacterium]